MELEVGQSCLPFVQATNLYKGPHIGVEYAWPMSLLLQTMTSDNDTEIAECLRYVVDSSRLGLVHESINVNQIMDYTSKSFIQKPNTMHSC